MNNEDFEKRITETSTATYRVGVQTERERIIGLLEHQKVWNSLDNKWVHPTYCITCWNIERITPENERIDGE